MRELLLSLLVLLGATGAAGQVASEPKFSRPLWAAHDSFSVRFSNAPGFAPVFRVSEHDTLALGTDGAIGLRAIIRTGTDSVIVPYRNLPYEQTLWFTIRSPKGSTAYRLRFNRVQAAFPEAYIRKRTGAVALEVPEAFELANIVWTLSPAGREADNLNKKGAYYERVRRYFAPYLGHPLFRQLDFRGDSAFERYIDFRENSFAFRFDESGHLRSGGPYYYVHGNDPQFGSLFKDLAPLLEDFARRSRFREFYRANRAHYEQLIARQRQLMPLRAMWHWLEQEFPERVQAYKVVFSPLIDAAHSTQVFSNFHNGNWFTETVMFICGPDRFDTRARLTPKQQEGLQSAIVFTEIDHNYVNPLSARYRAAIDSAFRDRAIWTAGGDTRYYGSPEAVFNEYMTHAVYGLYARDRYDSATATFLIREREALMADHRGYVRFRAFNQELMRLRRLHPGARVETLYPALIAWCREQGASFRAQ